VTGLRRLAATSILFFAVAAAPAAASGGSGGGGLGGSGGTSTTSTTQTSTTPSPTTTTLQTGSQMPTSTSSTSTSQVVRAFGGRMLQLGMRGFDVTILQRDLGALGYRIPVSGTFNALTLRELKSFQRRYHLTVDGVAGPTTITTLKRLLSSKLHIAESALGTGLTTTTTTPGTTTTGTGTSTTGTTSTSSTVQDATLIDGIAVPAQGTPQLIVQMLDAGNQIAFDPYVYGGGHGSFTAAGYDCSGSVSYVLHAGGLLATPLDSEQFLQYGLPGEGTWITIYTNGPTHAYMEIAGLWFDTAAQTALNGNDRWSTVRIAEPGYGTFKPRHPANW
jgi:cell wall-associated NlpC family hydrolase